MATRRAARHLPRLGGGRLPVRALLVLVVVTLVGATTLFSSATFTSSSTSQTTVGAAADYLPPTVAVTGPGALSTGTVAVTADASDTASGVVRVVVEYAASPSGAWTALCTDTAAPWSCPWDTTKVADGDYRLRATAYDAAGFSAVSATVTTRVANSAGVVLGTIVDPTRGTVQLSATVVGAAGRSVSSSFQYRASDSTGNWTVITGCGAVTGTAPTCSWVTGTLADDLDVRVVSTVGTVTVTDTRLSVTVDNLAPTVSLSAPTAFSGTVQLTATAADEDSGVATVELQYRLLGTAGWTTHCTVAVDPYRCALDTTKLTNLATYELRAVATDAAGNVTNSALLTRQVDNTLGTVSITSPIGGDLVRGTPTITTDHSTPLGTTASQVRIEARLVGGTFATVCTDTSAPFTCDWATGALASGSWELRATMTYGAALTAVSPIVTVLVDNNPLRALDVQVVNGGLLGKADGGDALTLTWSTTVDLTTVKAGWTGAATPFSLTLNDQKVNGSPLAGADWAGLGTLGKLSFGQNYVKRGKSVPLTGTMTATTQTVGGVPATVLRIVLDPVSNGALRSATAAATVRWYPTTTVRSTGGAAASATPAAESGAVDADL
ncbi:Ig-like domain-containing protein [Nocardioides perillae]|uniref:Signal peptidase I n=1 Tax=Nocardioides perillae TaxID=1119534 RepID=A0A7Y9UNN2_9ACTN|nr:Ig-like domain-containing protein [Nocardioides perillae]NYG56651.1 hypothetical protein [Nocardioides perillae]